MSAFESIISQEYRDIPWASPEGASASIEDYAAAGSAAFDLKRLAFLHEELLKTLKPKRAGGRGGVLERLVNEFKAWHERIRELRGEPACETAQVLQDWLDLSPRTHPFRRHALCLLVQLAASSEEFPYSLFIVGVELNEAHDAPFSGGFADVFRGTYRGQVVAIKRPRVTDAVSNPRARIFREALVWRQLDHPFVLPFIGIHVRTSDRIGLVAPWRERGTLKVYMQSEMYHQKPDSHRLMTEIADGLVYLHDQKVVHGDINDVNVLISDRGHAQLADFGLAIISEQTEAHMTRTSTNAGSTAWMSPERITGEDHRRCTADDVYAFGCLGYLLLSGQRPFHNISDTAVLLKVLAGQRPPRPQRVESKADFERVWRLIEVCWSQQAANRPSMSTAFAMLRQTMLPEPEAPAQNELAEADLDEDRENTVFKMYAKLFRLDDGWKGGMGNVRLLSHQATGKTRLVMYSDENPRVRADHPVSVDMRLQHNGGSDSDRSWVWQVTADYSGDSPTRGTFAVRFGSVEDANEFEKAFKEAQTAKPSSMEALTNRLSLLSEQVNMKNLEGPVSVPQPISVLTTSEANVKAATLAQGSTLIEPVHGTVSDVSLPSTSPPTAASIPSSAQIRQSLHPDDYNSRWSGVVELDSHCADMDAPPHASVTWSSADQKDYDERLLRLREHERAGWEHECGERQYHSDAHNLNRKALWRERRETIQSQKREHSGELSNPVTHGPVSSTSPRYVQATDRRPTSQQAIPLRASHSPPRSTPPESQGARPTLMQPTPTPGESAQSAKPTSRRQGFWNRRGDLAVDMGRGHLVVYAASIGSTDPPELADYPLPLEGYLDDTGVFLPYDAGRVVVSPIVY